MRISCCLGSSPPARGPQLGFYGSDPHLGLIPACAGTTYPKLRAAHALTAHPRLRGDHLVGLRAGPRVGGLIPACAGTTLACRWGRGWGRAHPRLRGDHRHRERSTSATSGSSPPARGPPPARPLPGAQTGLIPACAGTTVLRCALHTPNTAHPRLRGDHYHSRCKA